MERRRRHNRANPYRGTEGNGGTHIVWQLYNYTVARLARWHTNTNENTKMAIGHVIDERRSQGDRRHEG